MARLARPWMPLIRGSLTARLVASLVALVIVTCAVLGMATWSVLNKQLMASFNDQLMSATQRQYAQCVNPSGSGSKSAPNSTSAEYTNTKTTAAASSSAGSSPCGPVNGQAAGTFGAKLASNGEVINPTITWGTCSVSESDESTLKAIPATAFAQHGPDNMSSIPPNLPTYTRDLPSLGGDYELTAVKTPNGTTLYTGLPLHNVEGTLRNVAIAEIAVFAVVVLLVAGAGAGLVRFSLRPLRRVAATATMVTELPLDTGEVSLPARVPDADPRTEVGQVGAAFNRMLQHVESALAHRAASETRLRRFAADASHELRTPLSAIRGYAELALRRGDPVPEEVRHALERVESESARMSLLVDELLLLARLDAGRPLVMEPVDLTMLTIEATSDARVASPSHRWLLELPDEPLTVPGDELRLRQVLGNLLSNAAKHTAADSTVTVAVATTTYMPPAPAPTAAGTGPEAVPGAVPGSGPGRPAVQLTVTDDGAGIPADLQPELFERFVRGDSSRSHAAGSTGLGLAIVKAVVAAHHGEVSVASRPGRTTFTILLPRLPETADPEDTRHDLPADLASFGEDPLPGGSAAE